MQQDGYRDLPIGTTEKLQIALVRSQKLRGVGPLIRMWLKWRGVQIPPHTFEHPPVLRHIGPVVVHERTRIGKGVEIFHNVTIGRANVWQRPHPEFVGFEIRDQAILGAGAVILASRGTLVVGEGTVIGANSVLRQSTGAWELWAGNPAVKVGERRLADRRVADAVQ